MSDVKNTVGYSSDTHPTVLVGPITARASVTAADSAPAITPYLVLPTDAAYAAPACPEFDLGFVQRAYDSCLSIFVNGAANATYTVEVQMAPVLSRNSEGRPISALNFAKIGTITGTGPQLLRIENQLPGIYRFVVTAVTVGIGVYYFRTE